MTDTPPPKALRKFALIAFLFFGVIAALQWRHEHETAMRVFGLLSAWGLLSALTVPMLIRPLHLVLTKVAHAIGWLNTRLLLGLMFYLLFTPIGLLLRLFGRDLLHRKIDKSAPSYWIPKEQKPFDRKDYEKQF